MRLKLFVLNVSFTNFIQTISWNHQLKKARNCSRQIGRVSKILVGKCFFNGARHEQKASYIPYKGKGRWTFKKYETVPNKLPPWKSVPFTRFTGYVWSCVFFRMNLSSTFSWNIKLKKTRNNKLFSEEFQDFLRKVVFYWAMHEIEESYTHFIQNGISTPPLKKYKTVPNNNQPCKATYQPFTEFNKKIVKVMVKLCFLRKVCKLKLQVAIFIFKEYEIFLTKELLLT